MLKAHSVKCVVAPGSYPSSAIHTLVPFSHSDRAEAGRKSGVRMKRLLLAMILAAVQAAAFRHRAPVGETTKYGIEVENVDWQRPA